MAGNISASQLNTGVASMSPILWAISRMKRIATIADMMLPTLFTSEFATGRTYLTNITPNPIRAAIYRMLVTGSGSPGSRLMNSSLPCSYAFCMGFPLLSLWVGFLLVGYHISVFSGYWGCNI